MGNRCLNHVFSPWSPALAAAVWCASQVRSTQTGGLARLICWDGQLRVALLGREACGPQTREAASLPGMTPLMKAESHSKSSEMKTCYEDLMKIYK